MMNITTRQQSGSVVCTPVLGGSYTAGSGFNSSSGRPHVPEGFEEVFEAVLRLKIEASDVEDLAWEVLERGGLVR